MMEKVGREINKFMPEFRHKRSLGQNFILDDAIIDRILHCADLTPRDNVLEIGPGAGVMTAHMAEAVARVLAIEIDESLAPMLSGALRAHGNAVVIYGDALTIDLSYAIRSEFGETPYRVVANIPYYMTTDIIVKLITLDNKPSDISVMVQREAADRIMAKPGQKAYCALSAKVRYFGEATETLRLPPEAFTPRPRVESSFLRIIPREIPLFSPKDEKLLLRVIDLCFAMRRKTLLNNLKAGFAVSSETAVEWLRLAGIQRSARGEALDLSELVRLCDIISGAL
jgi:16S rRNA (adenine1518-N6/adenine1519-N6)-dimethyltransferase